MKCFYHNDLDGRAAGFCVYTWAGISGTNNINLTMHEINYGKPFLFDIILPDEQVWIVDYSITPGEMLKLLDITKRVTWVDQHKTAIEKYSSFDRQINGVRKDGVAGCVLTWKYLHWWSARGQEPIDLGPDKSTVFPVPRMIELVGDRDIWAWKYGDETKFFFAGSQLHNTSPTSDFWWRCMEHEIKDLPLPNTGNKAARIRGEKFWDGLLRDGMTIEKYKSQIDNDINGSLGFDCEFAGYKCWAINRAYISSDRLGDRIFKYDIVLSFYYDGTQWTISLYSERVDVSIIAKAHGGGGHKGAAGFQSKELPIGRANMRAQGQAYKEGGLKCRFLYGLREY